MGRLAEKALEIGLAELAAGAGEQGGNNRGPWVKKYLALCGLPEGSPWWASFVSLCYRQAADALGVCRPVPPIPCARRLYRAAVKVGGVRKPEEAQPGDIICWTRDGGPANGHVGMVVSVDVAGGVIHTLEGNSTPRVERFGRPLNGDKRRIGIARVDDQPLLVKP